MEPGTYRSQVTITHGNAINNQAGALETRDASAVEFDFAGRPWKTWQPNAESGQIGYNINSSAMVEAHYDAAGNVVTSIDALGRQSNFGYDVMGRKISEAGPFMTALLGADEPASGPRSDGQSGRHVTSTSYNGRGQAVFVSSGFLPVGASGIVAPRYSYTQFDGLGRATRTISSATPLTVPTSARQTPPMTIMGT